VFSEESLIILRSRGDNPELVNNRRAVSNTSYISADSLDSQATVEIPDKLESVETLRFLEFTLFTANLIFSKFADSKSTDPDRAHILHSAKDHIRSISGDAIDCNDDAAWISMMQRIGLSSNYQSRIMDTDFSAMRRMASAKEWALEMVELRYEFLLQLDAVIKAPSRGIGKKVSHMSLDGKLQPGRPDIPARSSSSKAVPPMKNFIPQQASAAAVEYPPDELAGHKLFFKGGVMHRLQKVFTKDGQLLFTNVCSLPPGDLSRITGGLYMTKNPQVAWRYAQWAKKLVDGNVVPVAIMTVAVPVELLASTKELYGEEWRRFVWVNRKGSEPLPKDLEYLEDFRWLIGPVCSKSNIQVQEMKDISELELWKLCGGETAQQIWTGNPRTLRLLNEHCIGKVWVQGIADQK
jgi:hypothetical protein